MITFETESNSCIYVIISEGGKIHRRTYVQSQKEQLLLEFPESQSVVEQMGW